MSDETFFPLAKIREAESKGETSVRNVYGDTLKPRTDLYCRQCGNDRIWEKPGGDYYHGTGTVCSSCGEYDCCTPEKK